MRFQPLQDWLDENFTTPPPIATARVWCERREIEAKKYGRKWFVVVDAKGNEETKRERRINEIAKG